MLTILFRLAYFATIAWTSQSAPSKNDFEIPRLTVFINSPVNIVNEGDSLDLVCSAGGKPVVTTMHWLLNGKRLTVGDHEDDGLVVEQVANDEVGKMYQLGVTYSKLRIPCVGKTSIGTYQCVASNMVNTQSASATVQFSRNSNEVETVGCSNKRSEWPLSAKSAEIYMWTDSRIERPGVNVQLMCRSKGNPKPKTQWYEMVRRNQGDSTDETVLRPIEDNELIQVLPNGDLLAKTPLHSTEGATVYKCIASNAWGEDSVDVMLMWPSDN